ncbi:MAG: hypothetical protein GT601_15940, partial [Acidaminobacter sp.]|uniref:hypothetical protein n=1 Tax=Acidaminobacter sp. TaxID=1872102 RepID=UPI001382FE8D
ETEPQHARKELSPELKAALSELAAANKQNSMEEFNEGLHGSENAPNVPEFTIHSELAEESGVHEGAPGNRAAQSQSTKMDKAVSKGEPVEAQASAAGQRAAEAGVKPQVPPKP